METLRKGTKPEHAQLIDDATLKRFVRATNGNLPLVRNLHPCGRGVGAWVRCVAPCSSAAHAQNQKNVKGATRFSAKAWPDQLHGVLDTPCFKAFRIGPSSSPGFPPRDPPNRDMQSPMMRIAAKAPDAATLPTAAVAAESWTAPASTAIGAMSARDLARSQREARSD
eukprot:363291-Chlamydomonas_euryale.AAC.8